jgi:hypothetical protein
MLASAIKGQTTYHSNPSPTDSVVVTSYSQSGTTLRRIPILCRITQDYPDRQTEMGLGDKKGTPREE